MGVKELKYLSFLIKTNIYRQPNKFKQPLIEGQNYMIDFLDSIMKIKWLNLQIRSELYPLLESRVSS
jgi:hypothetical protein